MASIVKRVNHLLKGKGIPECVKNNTHYEVIMGSNAYGVSNDMSDTDIYGFCIPEKNVLFPHLAGYIKGFGKGAPSFDQWQQHHIEDKEKGREYDVQIFSIVKYFQLCMKNNPNMIDSLFVPQRCAVHLTNVGTYVRDNRKKFLHKGCMHSFRGYAFQQMHKAEIKTPKEGSKRYEMVKKHGWDVKFGYHVVRLLNECEQILTYGDLDLEQNNEHLKAIRRGEVSYEEVKEWFSNKERSLQKMYDESKLPHSPDEDAIKQVLIDCLEMHYGSLEKCVIQPDKAVLALREVGDVIKKYRELL